MASSRSKSRAGSEELLDAKCVGLMDVIEQVIARHNNGEQMLDEKTFRLLEMAKAINRAKDLEEFLQAVEELWPKRSIS